MPTDCSSAWDATAASACPTSSSACPPDSVDWAQSFSGRGAQWIANTGFGYGDTELVAYSERLMALFAKELAVDGSLTTGQALSLAKRDYAKTTQVWSPYDEKALQEVVHYGLPMYRIAATSPAAFAVAHRRPLPPRQPRHSSRHRTRSPRFRRHR